jgi:hypothetical protein
VYDLLVRLSSKILVALFVISIVQACGAQCSAPSPLSRHLSHFRVGPTSVLNALVWLGHDTGVCFGIEYSGPELNDRIRVDESETIVGSVARKILGSAYQFSVSEGVVLVHKKGANPPSWLYHRLYNFKVPRVELMIADAQLWMQLEMDLDRTKRGFGGDSPRSEPPDEVGPLEEHEATIQQLLVKIVAMSRGAAWFPTSESLGTSFPASINRFWTMATYNTPNAIRPAVTRWLAPDKGYR